MMMMEMYFHFRTNEYILFHEWNAGDDITAYVFSCIGVGVIGFIYELLRFGRFVVQEKDRSRRRFTQITEDSCCTHNDDAPIVTREYSHLHSLYDGYHIADTILFFIQLYGSYSIMLIWMTYNVPILCSSALGQIIGYVILGPLMSVKEEEKIGDCCS